MRGESLQLERHFTETPLRNPWLDFTFFCFLPATQHRSSTLSPLSQHAWWLVRWHDVQNGGAAPLACLQKSEDYKNWKSTRMGMDVQFSKRSDSKLNMCQQTALSSRWVHIFLLDSQGRLVRRPRSSNPQKANFRPVLADIGTDPWFCYLQQQK